VDSETQRQIHELDEQRGAHKARLQVLEVQAARMGNSTPPEVVTEITEIKAKLVPIDAAIFKLTYVGTVRADVPSDDRDRNGILSWLTTATERTLERHRRAVVAAQTDQLMYVEVRIDAVMKEIRTVLLIVGVLAGLALLLSSGTLVYLVTR
jgi:hypothetical protein